VAKSLGVGLSAFSASYIALMLAAAWLLPSNGWLGSVWLLYLVVYAVTALCAVLIGTAAGRVTPTGVAACSLAIQVAVVAIVIGSTVVLDLLGSNLTVPLPWLGHALAGVWLSWLGGSVAAVIWPVVWSLVLRHVTPRGIQPVGS
jgi:hypothetical protein